MVKNVVIIILFYYFLIKKAMCFRRDMITYCLISRKRQCVSNDASFQGNADVLHIMQKGQHVSNYVSFQRNASELQIMFVSRETPVYIKSCLIP